MRGPALGALLLLLAGGCLQIETRVKLNEDGSAVITERVRLSRQLLDLAGERKAELLRTLGREAALDRMKQMGQGLVLVKHELRDAEGASKESWAEFTVDDINKFQYVSPWPAYGDYPENNVVKCEMRPIYKGRFAGAMSVDFRHEKNPQGRRPPPKDAPAPPAITPLDLQVYRELGPITRDMLSGLRLKFSFESYAPVHSVMGVRGESSGATVVDLLDVSDANMDKWGGAFLENEEVMLELAQLQFEGSNVVQNVQGYWSNETLPVFFPAGSPCMWYTWGPRIRFAPSRPLFDKHFAGKNVDYTENPPEKPVPAEFDKIGWQKRKTQAGAEGSRAD